MVLELHRVRSVNLVVVLPVGPDLQYDFIVDTIESIRYFTDSEYVIIAIDDSGHDVGLRLKADYPSIHVIKAAGQQGIYGGLYFGTSLALRYALENFSFSVLLRLDTDALVIGPNADRDAADFFHKNPDVGLIGSYKFGSDGNPRDFTPPRRRLKQELSLTRMLFEPHERANIRFLRAVVDLAVANRYELGEHCLAAATFFSGACVQALEAKGFLGREEFRSSRLGDDHLFSLLVKAANFQIGDFATGALPIAVRWRGLPFSPEELLARKKKITHSTRFWEDLDEAQIREFFRSKRHAS